MRARLPCTATMPTAQTPLQGISNERSAKGLLQTFRSCAKAVRKQLSGALANWLALKIEASLAILEYCNHEFVKNPRQLEEFQRSKTDEP